VLSILAKNKYHALSYNLNLDKNWSILGFMITSYILISFPSLSCSAIKLNIMNSSIHIDAVIDPLSPAGQKLSPLLRILWRQIQPSMRIVLNPIVCIIYPSQFTYDSASKISQNLYFC
jgi:hypothetical protein